MDDSVTVAMTMERDITVPARDGIALATDVHRPQGNGPFPVILERTPCDKTAPSRSERTAADPRHPARRRLRPEAGDPGLSQCAGRCARSGGPGGARSGGLGSAPRVARSRIFVDRFRPSHLVRPVAPRV